MRYIKPDKVISPKNRWKLVRVLYPGTEGEWAAAEGEWDGKEVLAIRWNGSTGNKIGQPLAHRYPTWFIVPDELDGVIRAVIDLLLENEKKQV